MGVQEHRGEKRAVCTERTLIARKCHAAPLHARIDQNAAHGAAFLYHEKPVQATKQRDMTAQLQEAQTVILRHKPQINGQSEAAACIRRNFHRARLFQRQYTAGQRNGENPLVSSIYFDARNGKQLGRRKFSEYNIFYF